LEKDNQKAIGKKQKKKNEKNFFGVVSFCFCFFKLKSRKDKKVLSSTFSPERNKKIPHRHRKKSPKKKFIFFFIGR
jgi:hypothetical protein